MKINEAWANEDRKTEPIEPEPIEPISYSSYLAMPTYQDPGQKWAGGIKKYSLHLSCVTIERDELRGWSKRSWWRKNIIILVRWEGHVVQVSFYKTKELAISSYQLGYFKIQKLRFPQYFFNRNFSTLLYFVLALVDTLGLGAFLASKYDRWSWSSIREALYHLQNKILPSKQCIPRE